MRREIIDAARDSRKYYDGLDCPFWSIGFVLSARALVWYSTDTGTVAPWLRAAIKASNEQFHNAFDITH